MSEPSPQTPRSARAIILCVVALLALATSFLARRAGFYRIRAEAEEDSVDEQDEASLAEILVPGVEPLANGHAGRAFLSLLLPVALLTLPIVNVLGYRVPWGYEPGGFLIWAITGIGILLYVSRRVVRGLRA